MFVRRIPKEWGWLNYDGSTGDLDFVILGGETMYTQTYTHLYSNLFLIDFLLCTINDE